MNDSGTSHKQVLKSTGMVGGAQFVTIIIGILKTKIIAVLLGPNGVGIAGLLQGVVDMLRSATGFGINFSAVKDIAEANNSGNTERIARTFTILKRWLWGTGLLGMIVTVILCVPLSISSFGNSSYALPIAILSVVLLLTSLQEGRLALLQGLRRIGRMSEAKIVGAVSGLIIAIPLYWWLGIKGIVPAMILTAAGLLVVSWWFVRNIKVEKVPLSLKETFRGGLSIAKLGFFIVVAGFVFTLTMYITRAFIAKRVGADGVGMFQASWNISNIYMGLILNAMLADFFPRLSEKSGNHEVLTRLTNEQSEVAFILGAPMIVGILLFIPFILHILYSSQFLEAVVILQWQMAGAFITFMAWPLGVIFLAKGNGIYCVLTDGIWCVVYIISILVGWAKFGMEILGMATVIAGVVKYGLVYGIVKTRYDFAWTKKNLKLMLFYGSMALISFCIVNWMTGWWKYGFGTGVLVLVMIHSYCELRKLINIPELLERIRNRFHK